MGTIALFIDGGYLDKVAQLDFPPAKIAMDKLAEVMKEEHELLRCFYYHSLPYHWGDATPEDRNFYDSKHRLFKAISFFDSFQVRVGKLVPNGHGDFEQKQVDVRLALDMYHLALKHLVSRVAILTGDGDFVPLIQDVQHEGVHVTLWSGITENSRPNRELYELADSRRDINQQLFDKICLGRGYANRGEGNLSEQVV